MAKKQRPAVAPKPAAQDKPATLKDLINPDVLSKLQAQADAMKAAEAKQKEDARQQIVDARKAEQKRLENDFEYLLNNSGTKGTKY
ncbi:DUF3886 domain-containing protein [Paenibacillus sp. WQ 127069]|uniref:DUF3886 domain-containing protein n=1 Tax=Paenibacillus baimaensis TaxID=2982185 RepID=A0ABT2U8F2_9BACL|nr:DUF3886 domain-containing protein [Paenibacillus sp. WQ 127069]MCU6790910.1 DUF3886 domain-containing protein [Paenibacillus sp. WQ 127069]